MILTSCNDITYIRPFEVQYFFCRKCLSIGLDNLYTILNEKSKVATKSACVISHKFSAQNTWEIRQALAKTLDCNYFSQIDSHFGDDVKEPNIWYILYNAIRREDFFSRKIDHFIQGEKMGKSGNYFIQYDKNTY